MALTKKDIQEVVNKINALDVDDPEKAHSEADFLILSIVPKEIAIAYLKLIERSPWWAAG